MAGSMLGHAADWFKSRNTTIRAWYSDDSGRYAFRVRVRDQDFVVCAKKYLKDGDTASFMRKKVLERASDMDALVLLFVGEQDRWLVFDPRQFLAHGRVPGAESDRHTGGEDWLDGDADWGVSFEAWYEGLDDPQYDPAQKDDDADATADGPDRPWDITAWNEGGDA